MLMTVAKSLVFLKAQTMGLAFIFLGEDSQKPRGWYHQQPGAEAGILLLHCSQGPSLLTAWRGKGLYLFIYYCILDFGVHVKNMQDSCIGTHVAV